MVELLTEPRSAGDLVTFIDLQPKIYLGRAEHAS